MTQITQHFSLEEMTESQQGSRLGLDNTPPENVRKNLLRLCERLEDVREKVGGPIRISSGYRSPAVNRAVGGASNSDHMFGCAADMNRTGMTPYEFAKAIIDAGIEFHQLILEYDAWVHMSVPVDGVKAKKQVLTIRKGTGYMLGLVKR